MTDYRATLQLPQTAFPMKANLRELEPQLLARWQELDLYRRLLDKNRGHPTFIFHDGPPYSNGNIHLGTVLNKILKDIVVKQRGMAGSFAPFVPGFDNHGMPIENNILKEIRDAGGRPTRREVRQRSRDFSRTWVDVQTREFQRLGVLADWSHAYLTMSNEYEARILEIFAEVVDRGFIYRGLRPVHWCPTCQTALANIEIEYEAKTSHSIWMRFPLVADPDRIFGDAPAGHAFAVVWTTTPWTIPANLALTVHPDFTYVVVAEGEDRYLLAEALLAPTAQVLGWHETRVARRVSGRDLARLVFRHPIFERRAPVLLGSFVTGDQGTGIVHTAPGHGLEDFEIGQQYGLDVLCPVDEAGRMTKDAHQFAGLDLKTCESAVMAAMTDQQNLLHRATLDHQYPFCWRCHNPLIFRTTQQWFLSVEHRDTRRRALGAVDDVRWVPTESVERIRAFLGNRPDWCLSRQRYWGVGIPAFYCEDCGAPLLTGDLARRVAGLVRAHSAEVWFNTDADGRPEILRHLPDLVCPACGSRQLAPEKDVLDVWFDSGCSHRIVLEGWPDHRWPADLYLEGSDQHRGWFNLSLLIGVATRDQAPYRAVVTHGFVLAADGRAMHKHLGNVIYPQDIIDRHGAEILRLWVAASDYFADIVCSPEVLERMVEAYRKLRNTFRFLLANLHDFEPARDALAHESLLPIDRFILARLAALVTRVTAAYERYEYHTVFHDLYDFCVVLLSAFYLDVSKDRLYTHGRTWPSRRSAQTVMHEVLSVLLRLAAPVLSFTAEQAYGFLPGRRADSVFLDDFPVADPRWVDPGLDAEWTTLLDVRGLVLARLEQERERKTIGSSLQAGILLAAAGGTRALLERHRDELPLIFIVSDVAFVEPEALSPAARRDEKLGVAVDFRLAPGTKCARCWIYAPTVGQSAAHPTLCAKCVSAVEGT